LSEGLGNRIDEGVMGPLWGRGRAAKTRAIVGGVVTASG